MEDSNLTIKKVYNEYTPSDHSYGEQDSVNLNPKREIKFDQLDKLAVRLQELTDDIIRKRIAPAPEPEEVIKSALGGESIPQGIPLPKQALLAQTGGIGNALLFPIINIGIEIGPIDSLLEQIIGTYPIPELLADIDKPIQLDCENILKQFEFVDSDFTEEEDENEEQDKYTNIDNVQGGSGGSAGGDTDSGDDSSDDSESEDAEAEDDEETEDADEEENEIEDCAEIELAWLKILLILVKIIRIIALIIDIVMSIIIPILEILRLAVGAWINPPNIPSIVQKIIQLIMGIIILLISLLLQLIWNLLNLDCICDQTASLIEQIQKAMSLFASVMGAFNPTAVNMLANRINKEVMDPFNEIMQTAHAKKEAWAEFGRTFDDQLAQIASPEFKQQMMDEMAAGIKEGFMKAASPKLGKISNIVQQGQALYKQVMGDSLKVMNDAKAAWDMVKGTKLQKPKPAASMLASEQFAAGGLSVQPGAAREE